jgi:tryptophanyl-tRNA synthetase
VLPDETRTGPFAQQGIHVRPEGRTTGNLDPPWRLDVSALPILSLTIFFSGYLSLSLSCSPTIFLSFFPALPLSPPLCYNPRMAESNEPKARTKSESGAVAREQDLNPLLPDGSRKRILTGDRTTGKLHLGHYIGSLKNRVRLQSQYDTFILLADVQALTTHYDRPEVLKQSVMDVALDYLAVGLDPFQGGDDDGSKAKFVIQSMVPSIAELTVYYGLLVSVGLLKSNPTTKAEAEQYNVAVESDVPQVLKDKAYEPFIRMLKQKYERMYPELGDVSINVYYNAMKSYWDDVLGYVVRAGDKKACLLISDEEMKGYEDIFPVSLEMDPLELLSDLLNLTHRYKQFRDYVMRAKRAGGMENVTYGFLGYPVSQAADITFVGAHLVPVGEDQVPHIELTREIVRRFNNQYGETLTVPQALIGGGGTVKGLDGSAKMSKSLDNAIYLSDSYDEIWRRISRAVTDPQRMRRNDPGRPEVCNIFSYHELFNAETEPAIAAANLDVLSVPETAKQCRSAGIGCVDCKKNLAKKLDALLAPMRERRAQWEAHPERVREVLLDGTRRANEEGEKTLAKVKQAMRVDYFAS